MNTEQAKSFIFPENRLTVTVTQLEGCGHCKLVN